MEASGGLDANAYVNCIAGVEIKLLIEREFFGINVTL